MVNALSCIRIHTPNIMQPFCTICWFSQFYISYIYRKGDPSRWIAHFGRRIGRAMHTVRYACQRINLFPGEKNQLTFIHQPVFLFNIFCCCCCSAVVSLFLLNEIPVGIFHSIQLLLSFKSFVYSLQLHASCYFFFCFVLAPNATETPR